MPSHWSSSGAWAKVHAQGTRHLQTSNQSPARRHWGASATRTSLGVAPLELVHLRVRVLVRERERIAGIDLPLDAVPDLGELVLEPVREGRCAPGARRESGMSGFTIGSMRLSPTSPSLKVPRRASRSTSSSIGATTGSRTSERTEEMISKKLAAVLAARDREDRIALLVARALTDDRLGDAVALVNRPGPVDGEAEADPVERDVAEAPVGDLPGEERLAVAVGG